MLVRGRKPLPMAAVVARRLCRSVAERAIPHNIFSPSLRSIIVAKGRKKEGFHIIKWDGNLLDMTCRKILFLLKATGFAGGSSPKRWLLALAVFAGCASKEVKPVELFPEDACSNCRMAVSDHRFASEIINDESEVFKFDDIGCMLTFKGKHSPMGIAAIFLQDYEKREWITYESAVIVETDVDTPMGSGKVAFADSTRAMEFQRQHPVNKTVSAKG